MNIKHIRTYLIACSLVVAFQPLQGPAQQNSDATKTGVQHIPTVPITLFIISDAQLQHRLEIAAVIGGVAAGACCATSLKPQWAFRATRATALAS